jgi:hypothetical protein
MRKHIPKHIAPSFNQHKFKELILYIASQCQNDRFWNATKLNKVLFYADFISYEHSGQAITGAEYFALPNGPAPKALVPIREEMIKDRDLAIVRRTLQHRPVALRDADLTAFSAQEIAIVDQVIAALRHKNAEMVSELSHAFLGWKAARAEGAATGKHVTIPYGTVFVSNTPIDEFEAAYGLDLVKKYGWAS